MASVGFHSGERCVWCKMIELQRTAGFQTIFSSSQNDIAIMISFFLPLEGVAHEITVTACTFYGKLSVIRCWLFTILKKSRSVRLENSEREELFTIYKNSDHGVFTQSASVAPGREN